MFSRNRKLVLTKFHLKTTFKIDRPVVRYIQIKTFIMDWYNSRNFKGI